jgi:hypothetical protein
MPESALYSEDLVAFYDLNHPIKIKYYKNCSCREMNERNYQRIIKDCLTNIFDIIFLKIFVRSVSNWYLHFSEIMVDYFNKKSPNKIMFC